jgi:hypothetical protein
MFIPDPDFYQSRISDPTIAPTEEGENFICPTIFKYLKIVNNFIFEQIKATDPVSPTLEPTHLEHFVLLLADLLIKLGPDLLLGLVGGGVGRQELGHAPLL